MSAIAMTPRMGIADMRTYVALALLAVTSAAHAQNTDIFLADLTMSATRNASASALAFRVVETAAYATRPLVSSSACRSNSRR